MPPLNYLSRQRLCRENNSAIISWGPFTCAIFKQMAHVGACGLSECMKTQITSVGIGGGSLTKSKKTSSNSMFEINMERFGGSWYSITHPHDPSVLKVFITHFRLYKSSS
jgi:hypothetical protein